MCHPVTNTTQQQLHPNLLSRNALLRLDHLPTRSSGGATDAAVHRGFRRHGHL